MSEENKTKNEEQTASNEIDSLINEVQGMFSQDDPFQVEPISTQEEEEETKEDQNKETHDSEEDEDKEEGKETNEKDDEIKSLKEELAELKALIKEGKAEKEPETQEEKKEEIKKLLTLSDDQFEEALSDKEKFESLFNNSHELIKAEILKLIPGLVTSLVSTTTATNNAVEKFKSDNADIFSEGVENEEQKNVRVSFIKTVANQIESSNPNLPIDEVLKKTAETVRQALNLKGTKTKTKETDNKKEKQQQAKGAPFLKNVNSTSNNKDGGELTDLQKEMAAMLRA